MRLGRYGHYVSARQRWLAIPNLLMHEIRVVRLTRPCASEFARGAGLSVECSVWVVR